MRIYLFILFIVFFSCKKDQQVDYETIYPLPYLPVYPGSHWTYLDENGDTLVQSTSSEYQLHSYKSFNLDGNNTDPVYVPYWNGYPVYGYSTPEYTTSGAFTDFHYGMKQVGYLSEQLGQSWSTYANQYGSSGRKVVNIDTTLLVNSILFNHVIKVNDYGSSYHEPPGNHLRATNYYAKDIGLIQQDEIYNDTLVIHHLKIISYFINQ
jgi:hypothetical protein